MAARHARTGLRQLAGGLLVLGILLAVAVILERTGFGSIRHAGHAEAIDGDSLRMNGVEMRLKGLDAPEYAQTCTDAGGRDTPCGRHARRVLAGMLRQPDVTCMERGKDSYGRALVTCRTGEADIGAQLVRQGIAVAFGRYEAEELEAKAARRGLWAGAFERPADWRRRHPRDGQARR